MADDGTTRGQFLSLSTVGMGAMIGAVIGVPATAYMLGPVFDEATFQPVFLGKIDQFTSEQGFDPTAATYVEDPENPATSPGLAWVHSTGKSNSDWLASDAMFVVFSNRCMHLGCPVQATSQGFQCPCHGGAYNTVGQRIAGPPIRPLDRFQWEIRNSDELWITQRWSVDFNGNGKVLYFPVKMPGQPVAPPGPSVVADVLYPNVTYDHGPVPQAK
ncbi:MAG TPA: ubiquinol-cytochrome c reductase iron-sulfur subunit [Gaiellales bacterium]|nr:ubiquinol-cytochrome c reductase iron-sulfur subunit [Gaiellales bacterium]